MSGIQDIATSRGTVYKVPFGKLAVEDGFNVREDYGDVEELARQIAENGQKTPMIVRLSDDASKVVIIDGHRRHQAIELANKKYDASIKEVACINEERGANEESRIVDMFVLGSGKPLTLLEQAEAVKRLLDYQWKPAQVAKKIGKTQSFISQLLNLQGATHELREAVRKGTISPTAAIKLSAAPADQQKEILKQVHALGLNGGAIQKIKVKDVEKATKGVPSTVSSKKIKTLISEVKVKIKEEDDSRNWEDVQYGLQLAIGLRKMR